MRTCSALGRSLRALGAWLVLCASLPGMLPPAVAQTNASTASAASAAPAPLSPESFFRSPDIRDARLSPSGQRLALLVGGAERREGLVVLELDDLKRSRVLARFDNADIRRFEWVNEERLVFDIVDRRAGSGDQRLAPGLFSVRADGSEMRQLVQLSNPFVVGARGLGREPLPYNHVLLHVPTGQGDAAEEVIVGRLEISAGEVTSITPLRLNVDTGRITQAYERRPTAQQWLFDSKGQARVAVQRAGGKVRYFWREPGQDEWTLLVEHDVLEAPWAPAFVDPQGRLLVTRLSPAGFRVLHRWDPATRAPASESFVSTPGFDFQGQLLADDVSGRLIGVRLDTDAETTVWFEDAMKRVQALADARSPGTINRLSCSRCSEPRRVVLVKSFSARDPGRYAVYREAKNEWVLIGPVRGDIEPRRMAEVDFQRIKARDGRDLPVWLTVPPSRKPTPRTSPPARPSSSCTAAPGRAAAVWQLGRPGRPVPGFARLCRHRARVPRQHRLRPCRTYRAGWQAMGPAPCRTTSTDSLKWAVKATGLASDPKRLCIAGASYGGYSTLIGLAKDTRTSTAAACRLAGRGRPAKCWSKGSLVGGRRHAGRSSPARSELPLDHRRRREGRRDAGRQLPPVASRPRASRRRCCWPSARTTDACRCSMAATCARRCRRPGCSPSG